MQDAHAFLANLTLVLCVAAVTTYLFQRIRQPVVFGYLVAGMIVGPYVGVPLFADRAMVSTLSELGVIMLMFGLGLEFSLSKLAQVGPRAGIVAVVDTGLMFGLGFGAGQLLGWTPIESVFTGGIVAISSTTIIVKAFAEQRVSGRFTELVFGVLIFEDLIAIFLIAILTTVAQGGGVSAAALGMTAGKLALFLALFVGFGLVIVPRVVRAVVRLDRAETTLVVSLGLCFGGALLALGAGYSVALGAFIAGSLVAESGEGKRIEHLVEGVRDMFAAVFFVSVGMMIDPTLVARHWQAVVLLSVVVMVGKFVAVSVGAFFTGNGVRTATQTGMSLTQIGEFAFIIAAVGLAEGATRDFLYPVAVAVSAITTLTTPIAIRSSQAVATFIDRRLPRPLQTFVGLYATWIERLRAPSAETSSVPLVRRKVRLLIVDAVLLSAVVIGASITRDAVTARAMEMLNIERAPATVVFALTAIVLALPFAVGLVRVSAALAQLLALRALPAATGNRLDYAEAPRRVLVATLRLAIATASGLFVVIITEPFVPIGRGAVLLALLVGWLAVLFWRSTTDLYGHTLAGAQVLMSVLAKQVAPVAESSAAASPAAAAQKSPRDIATVHRVLPGLGDPVPFTVAHDAFAEGKTLRDLQLRSATGAVILAITRGEENVLLPVGGERLHAGDVLALAGTTDAIEEASRLMTHGPHVFDRESPVVSGPM